RTFFFVSQPPRPPYHLRNVADKHRRPESVAPATASFTSSHGRGIPSNARGFAVPRHLRPARPKYPGEHSLRSPPSIHCLRPAAVLIDTVGPYEARASRQPSRNNQRSAQPRRPAPERFLRSPPSIYCLAAARPNTSARARLSFSSTSSQLAASAPECPGPASS